jgi:RNA polymerase sigma-70 factor, ECF subfamily
MNDPAEINALLLAVARQDPEAFRMLYERTSGYLMAIVLRICRDRHTAEDLLQDIYVQVWRRAASFDPKVGTAMGWLTVIARNRAIDHIRSHSRTHAQMADNMQQELDRLPALTPGVEQMSDLRAVVDGLTQLPADHGKAVLMAYYNGWSREELAQHFSVSENTIKTWLRRGLIALRARMDGDEHGGK